MIIKEENLYIKEYIHYYKKLGVKKVFIYDNNEVKGEKLNGILRNEIISKIVKIINVRGKKRNQINSYNNCISINRNKYDWLMFFDVDEFLYIENNQTLDEFLSESRYNKCEVIKINWLCYGDNDLLYYENKPVIERFIKNSKFKRCNALTKSIVNVKNNNISWGDKSVHYPYLNVKKACDSLGNRVNIRKRSISPPIHKHIYLKHYRTKSTDEFVDRIKKGDATFLIDKPLKFYKNRLKRYFALSKLTKEKIDIFSKKLNVSLYKYINRKKSSFKNINKYYYVKSN